jgi:hypothetical protein
VPARGVTGGGGSVLGGGSVGRASRARARGVPTAEDRACLVGPAVHGVVWAGTLPPSSSRAPLPPGGMSAWAPPIPMSDIRRKRGRVRSHPLRPDQGSQHEAVERRTPRRGPRPVAGVELSPAGRACGVSHVTRRMNSGRLRVIPVSVDPAHDQELLVEVPQPLPDGHMSSFVRCKDNRPASCR